MPDAYTDSSKNLNTPNVSVYSQEESHMVSEPESVVNSQPTHKSKKQLMLFLFIGAIVVFASLWYLFYSQKKNGKNAIGDSDPVMKVGEEVIYGKDVSYELSVYPEITDETRKLILAKIAADSITLQGAKDEGIIQLDASFYNSSSKDYSKRIEMVESVKNTLESRGDTIEGYLVSIWFRNNGYIGPLGLEKSKAEAFKKISELQKQVADKKITIQEAGNLIINDTSVEKLDLAYTNNAILQFKRNKGSGEKISLSDSLDNALWGLPVGSVSDVYLAQAKDLETGELHEALYSFGAVTAKNSEDKVYMSYDDWLTKKNALYETVYY